jgi:uncharacterized protein (DUF488 family)
MTRENKEPVGRFPRFVTIGVYGASGESFFHALQQAGVDTFCDIRWRRGVRGSQYAFVNSQRLQEHLSRMGIRYLHFRELAPSPQLRAKQAEQDHQDRVAKRQRTQLSQRFIAGYQAEVLSRFEPEDFLRKVAPARAVALFCVEKEPGACHRSLLAGKLQEHWGVIVDHLLPCSPES